jgi:hypothetical protein
MPLTTKTIGQFGCSHDFFPHFSVLASQMLHEVKHGLSLFFRRSFGCPQAYFRIL